MNLVKNKIREFIYNRYKISFSKAGDDIQLMKILNNSKPGCYVDIGCWHPVKASNTYFFYLRNWKGICIDPNPELKDVFQFYRPKDIFVNAAIGNNDENLNYYMLNDKHCSSMNTLDYSFLEKHNLQSEIKNTISIPTYSLAKILEEKLAPDDRLDFFDIDVEGFDLEVLKSNDWQKYRPKIVLVETELSLNEELSSDIFLYLESKNYRLIAKSVMIGDLGNLFFIDIQK